MKERKLITSNHFVSFSFLQEPLPVIPPGCSSEKPDAIQDFIVQGKAALVSVGIIRDSFLGNAPLDFFSLFH